VLFTPAATLVKTLSLPTEPKLTEFACVAVEFAPIATEFTPVTDVPAPRATEPSEVATAFVPSAIDEIPNDLEPEPIAVEVTPLLAPTVRPAELDATWPNSVSICDTLTASVKFTPAATFEIVLCTPALPIETVFAVDAIDPAPRATELTAVEATDAVLPIAMLSTAMAETDEFTPRAMPPAEAALDNMPMATEFTPPAEAELPSAIAPAPAAEAKLPSAKAPTPTAVAFPIATACAPVAVALPIAIAPTPEAVERPIATEPAPVAVDDAS
jgi:hypothetical protein